MKAPRTWILIANGARARIVENSGVGKGVTAVPGKAFEQKPNQAGDIMADRPGRTFDSKGSGRHAMEYGSDPVRVREKNFAGMLCEQLQQARAAGEYERLVVVASPQALGDLREAMSPDVKATLLEEIAKDLTHEPNNKLDRHLTDIIAV